jgi:hypothetical protein
MKNVKKLIFLIAIFFVLFSILLFQKKEINNIVVAISNSGKILIYSWNGKNFERDYIDVDYKFIHTVRIGDVYNKGKNVIVAGVGNSFYGPPFGCSVEVYEKSGNEWKKSVIDNAGDLRCKDLTIADVDNDGKNELVLGTHGEGLIKIYKWNGKNWSSQVIEKNWIKQVDEMMNANHRIPRENLTYDCIDQSAVHIVKVGDVDNDGKNEIIASISSPLEYLGEDISYLNLYKWNGTAFQRTTIDNQEGKEFRSIFIGDVRNNGKNAVLIGSGLIPTKKEFASLSIYEWENGNWNKSVIENEVLEKNMKGLALGDVYNKGKNAVVVATGFSDGLLYAYEWNGKKFSKSFVGNISKIFEVYFDNSIIPDIMHNSMEAQIKDVDGDGKNEIIVSGLSQTKKFGWEATTLGFTVIFKWDKNKWNYEVLDKYSALGMDVGIIGQ